MKQGIKHILIHCLAIFSVVLPGVVISQPQTNPYRIEGEEVVFTFDIRNYGKELISKGADRVDFSDLKIYDVAITGGFNDWSKEGWKMLKKSEFVYELRKRLEDFNDPFPLDFKYIINGKFIAVPGNNNSNSRQFTDDFLENVYNMDLSVLRVSETGNVLFKLDGHTNAYEVILAGSFNGWDEHAIKMKKGTDGWYLRANLPPGRYEYKFIVDGVWMHDPENKAHNFNEHGTLNSILDVTVPFTFTLEGFPNAKKVIVTGSFVDWNENKLRMVNINGVWRYTTALVGGKHQYKFIVDGQWLTDPSNPIIEDDGKGNLNSVLFIH
jgi:hypothetical protein